MAGEVPELEAALEKAAVAAAAAAAVAAVAEAVAEVAAEAKAEVAAQARLQASAVIDLANGQPSDALLLQAHEAIAAASVCALKPPRDGFSILNYGDVTGDASDITLSYRTRLASLLTRQYGYRVEADALLVGDLEGVKR